MQNYIDKWDKIKESVRIEHAMSSIAFDTWIAPLKFNRIEENNAYIVIPDSLAHLEDFLRKKYLLPLKVAISEELQEEYNVIFIKEQEIRNYTPSKEENIIKEQNLEKANLNPKYTFDSFVVGDNNRLAQSACLAVAEKPGDVYNPLFLYGGVGLGKTHLMHSIGNYIIENNPNANVLYVTSEQFTNEVIEAIRTGNNSTAAMSRLREKYRNIDVLLIDDIQFIIGKESTQEEFFHTFNHLHEQKKQIIISSDKPPKSMDVLEERFKSRFAWGLTADIQTPNFETRTAILKKKKEVEIYEISDDVIKYIAENIVSNIRELEGALNKLIALSNLEKKKIDIDLAKDALKDIISPNTPVKITPDYIMRIVCDHYSVTESDLASSKRNKELILPRYMFIYLCRTLTDYTYKGIASYIGNRDHTTIMHGESAIKDLIDKDKSIKNSYEVLINKLNSN